jgi:hypothetical protein
MNTSPINTGRTQFFAENFSVLTVAAAQDTEIARMIVPSKCRLRVLEIGNYIGTVAAWGLIVWHARCNGITVAPYNAVLDQIGYAAQRSQVEKLEFGGGSILTITADNNHVANVQVGVSLAWELIYQE